MTVALPGVDVIVSRLEAHVPRVAPPIEEAADARTIRLAAVAVLLVDAADGPEVLFIERARREGDHWSGDIAFPGGRRDPGDPDVESTARRETAEEIGVALPPPIARLDDFDARTGRRPWPLVVSSFAYVLPARPRCVTNHEVADVLWAPMHHLVARDATTRRRLPHTGEHVSVPAIRLDHRVVWGMTYRMLLHFLDVALDRPRVPDGQRTP